MRFRILLHFYRKIRVNLGAECRQPSNLICYARRAACSLAFQTNRQIMVSAAFHTYKYHQLATFVRFPDNQAVLPLDEAIASRAVFVIVSGSDGWADGRAETLLEPAK